MRLIQRSHTSPLPLQSTSNPQPLCSCYTRYIILVFLLHSFQASHSLQCTLLTGARRCVVLLCTGVRQGVVQSPASSGLELSHPQYILPFSLSLSLSLSLSAHSHSMPSLIIAIHTPCRQDTAFRSLSSYTSQFLRTRCARAKEDGVFGSVITIAVDINKCLGVIKLLFSLNP